MSDNPNPLKIVESIEADPTAAVKTLRDLAELEASDHSQILVRISAAGAKTVILGIEPEGFEDDESSPDWEAS